MSSKESEKKAVLRLSIDSQNSTASDDSQLIDNLPKTLVEKGYSIGEKLGSGAFSTVYKATNSKQPGVTLACKRFDLTDRSQEVWREKCLKSEMKIMLKLKHPNIIKAQDVFKTRKLAFIFMAFAKNGSVGEYLEKTKNPIPEKLSKSWFRDILCAVAFMHSKYVAHRDIKPDNFLLDNDYKDAILGDFGFSCMNTDTQRLMKGTNCGTELYKAPELLELVEGHVYDAKKADIYALGLSLFEMLNYNKAFGESMESNSFANYIRKQKSKKYNLNKEVKLSKNSINILDLLLEPEANRRADAQVLLNHKWFTTN